MAEPIIRVESLGKKYLIKHQQAGERYRALRDVLAGGVRTGFGLFGRNGSRGTSTEEFWALNDVSFDVHEGEVVGIIGRNGAGKSTLLKILSRITEPTTGRVTLHGRVASLLEVGTGFHPELTGRENVYLNGSILGMTRREIARKFDEIVAFAEVERFLDTPVKRYSSGMYVRLAFAVAAHLEPEILVVDEVLAVGDAAFQKKCLGKMGEVARGGRTVLFVSHNMGVIQQLCGRCVLLAEGRVAAVSDATHVIRRYMAVASKPQYVNRMPATTERPVIHTATIRLNSGLEEVVYIDVTIRGNRGQRLSLDVRLVDGMSAPVGFGSLGTLADTVMVVLRDQLTQITLKLDTRMLANGSYFVGLDLTNPTVEFFDRLDPVLTFELDRPPLPGQTRVLPQSWGYGSMILPIERADQQVPVAR